MSTPGRAPAEETLVEHNNGRHDGPFVIMPQNRSDLLPYLRLFFENRQFLLRVGVRALVVSTLVGFLIPVRYRSVTRIMPPDAQSGAGLGMIAAMANRAGAGSLAGLAGDLLGVKSTGELFVAILGSDTVQDRLIEEFHLKYVYFLLNRLHIADSKIEDARRELAKHTEIGEDRKSGIITIAVIDHDPKRAAAMGQAYVRELDRMVAQVSTSAARRERVFLEERLAKVKGDLDSAARNFSDFASRNTAIDIPAQGKAMVEAAATLQGQLIAAQAQLSGLQQMYTEGNVRVRAAEARVNELRKKLDELGGAGDPSEPSRHSLYPSIRKLPLLGVTYADLYRQTKIQETVYELLTQQYELAKVQEAKEIPTVKVLDPAIVPTKKSFPPRILIIVVGTLLGITLAMTWIVGKTGWAMVDNNDPWKVFAAEVFKTVHVGLPKLPNNGAGGEVDGTHRRRLWTKRPSASARQDVEDREK